MKFNFSFSQSTQQQHCRCRGPTSRSIDRILPISLIRCPFLDFSRASEKRKRFQRSRRPPPTCSALIHIGILCIQQSLSKITIYVSESSNYLRKNYRAAMSAKRAQQARTENGTGRARRDTKLL